MVVSIGVSRTTKCLHVRWWRSIPTLHMSSAFSLVPSLCMYCLFTSPFSSYVLPHLPFSSYVPPFHLSLLFSLYSSSFLYASLFSYIIVMCRAEKRPPCENRRARPWRRDERPPGDTANDHLEARPRELRDAAENTPEGATAGMNAPE